MFKPLRMKHSRLDELVAKKIHPDGSSRQVNWSAHKCVSTKDWVLVWQMRTRQETLDYTREHFPEIVTGRDGSVTYYTSSGKQVPMMPKLHTDHTLEAFLVYFGTQDRPSRDWRDALRPDSDRRRELHDFMRHMAAHRHEIKARNLMGMRDYQKPFIDGLSNNINNLFGSFGSFGSFDRIRAPRRGDLARLARAYDPVPLSMRLSGGFKRGEVAMIAGLGSSADNARHMRLGLEAMRRFSSSEFDRPMLRVSFEDSAMDQHMNAAIESAMFRDFTTELPALRSIAFGHGGKYPNASPMLETGEALERLDMMHKGLIPYPDVHIADETWVTNGPFDPTKVTDIVNKMRFNAELPEHVSPETPLFQTDAHKKLTEAARNIRAHTPDIDVAESYPRYQTVPREVAHQLGYKTAFFDEEDKEVGAEDIQRHALNKGMSLKEAVDDMGLTERAVDPSKE